MGLRRVRTRRVGPRLGMRLGWIVRALMAVEMAKGMEGTGLIVEGFRRRPGVMEGTVVVGGCSCGRSRQRVPGSSGDPYEKFLLLNIAIFLSILGSYVILNIVLGFWVSYIGYFSRE
jgi:hypothetical protein